jgi:hypothetical protein
MAQLYLYQAVDIVTQKGKEAIISLWRRWAKNDAKLRRFTKYTNMPNVVGLKETITSKLVTENEYCFKQKK